MTQNHNDEIDLGVVIEKIKQLWKDFLVFIYGLIRFVFNHWIVLLLLLIGGVVGGYFWQEAAPMKKQATFIIQSNFNSTSYVYDALEGLNARLKQANPAFMKKHGFDEGFNGEIEEMEIEPIVNIIELLDKTDNTGRSLEEYMAQADFEENVLQSEVFYTEYDYHRMTLIVSGEVKNNFINKVIAYVNSNEKFREIQKVTVEELENRLKNHEKSIYDIEGVFESFRDKTALNVNPSQFVFKNSENNNLHLLLEEKRTIMDDMEKIKVQLLRSNEVVSLVNEPAFKYSFSLSDNKKVLLPIGLIFLYCFIHAIIRFYKRIKALAASRE